MNPRDGERVVMGEVGHDPRESARQHRLARTRRPHKEQVMPSRSSDLQRISSLTLATDVSKIGLGFDRIVGKR